MPALKGDALVRAVENLVAEKEAVTGKEKKLVSALNSALGKDGLSGGCRGPRGAGEAWQPASGADQPRWKPMSAAARRAVSPRMKAYWRKRKAAARKGSV